MQITRGKLLRGLMQSQFFRRIDTYTEPNLTEKLQNFWQINPRKYLGLQTDFHFKIIF